MVQLWANVVFLKTMPRLQQLNAAPLRNGLNPKNLHPRLFKACKHTGSRQKKWLFNGFEVKKIGHIAVIHWRLLAERSKTALLLWITSGGIIQRHQGHWDDPSAWITFQKLLPPCPLAQVLCWLFHGGTLTHFFLNKVNKHFDDTTLSCCWWIDVQ